MMAFYHKGMVVAPGDNGTWYVSTSPTGTAIQWYRRIQKCMDYFGIRWHHAVLKTLWYIEKQLFDELNFNRHRVDAVAMEQRTASPHVAVIYGYCANSLVGYSTKPDLYSIFEVKNPLTKEEFFKIAHDTVSAVVDVHYSDSDGKATILHMTLSWVSRFILMACTSSMTLI